MVTYTPNAAGQVESRSGPHPDDQWTFKYDHFGRLTEKKLTPAAGSAATPATWTAVYGPNAADAKGNDLGPGQVSQTDPAGYTTVASFNARGKLLKQVADDRGTSRESTNRQTSEYGYDGPFAKSEKVSEGLSVGTTTRTFDDRGRPTRQEEIWTKGSYGHDYVTISPWTGRTVAITQTYSSGPATRTQQSALEVDSQGNTIAKTLGSSGSSMTDRWLYDAVGMLTKESLSGKPERVNTYVEGLLTQSMYGGVESTGYSYYSDRRLQAVSYPSGRVRTGVWNRRGLLDLETYGVGADVQRTRTTYDPGGYASAVIQGFTTADEAARQYVNGPMGETLSVTLPGQVGSFAYGYDGARRLVSLTPPADSPTPAQSFQWDYLGRPAGRQRGASSWVMSWADGEVTETNPESDQQVRQHDSRGRQAHVQFRPGLGAAPYTDLTEIQYALGGDDQPMQVKETRHSGDVGTSFEYDSVGRTWKVTRSSEEVSYAYTPSGQRLSVTSPNGVTSYVYDSMDRVQTVTSSQGPTVSYEWEPGGDMLLSLKGSGLVERRCYDQRGRLRQVVHASGDALCSESLPSGLVSSYEYAYDERGNRTSEMYTDGLMLPAMTTYGYDLADRLTAMVGPGATATFYRVAGDGSRLREKTAVAAGALPNAPYDAVSGFGELVYDYQGPDQQGGLARILDAGSGAVVAGFTSDRVGRVTSETRGGVTRTFSWDAGSRLAQVAFSNGAAAIRYLYDWQGLRRAKTGATGVGYLWAGGELVEEQSAGGAAAVYARGDDGTVVGLGGERALHDGIGGVSGREGASPTLYRTDAWGNLQADAADSSRWSAPPSGGPSLGFGATNWDADAGLYYAQQRWYDARTGRWLSEDPVLGDLRNPSSLGLWAYADGDPLRYTDPTGEAPCRQRKPGESEAACQLRQIKEERGAERQQAHLGAFTPTDPQMQAYNKSLEKPVSTPGNLATFEEKDARQERMGRRRVEAAIQGMEHLNAVTAPMAKDLVLMYIGGRIINIAAEEVLALLERGAIRVAEAGASPELAARVAQREAMLADVPLPAGSAEGALGQVADAAGSEVAKASAGGTVLRGPASRHWAARVSQKTVAKSVNTVVEPGVNVAGDVAAINSGQAARQGGTYIINGRTYGVHDGTLYPISGPGFHQLSRAQFKALGVYNCFGDTVRTSGILAKMGISEADISAARAVFEVLR